MKHWLALAALICFGVTANAAPYFRLVDSKHIYKSVGAYVDPQSPGNSAYGTAIALITHSPKDGCIFPSIICEEWSPLMVGPSYNAGRFEVNVGPAANLAPSLQSGLWAITPDEWTAIKSALKPSNSPLTISFGPALNIAPIERGVIIPVTEWRGKFRIFAGAALRF